MSEHLLSERLAVVSCIDPDAYATGTQSGDAIDMSLHREVMFIVMAGTIASTGKVDFQVKECATSNGTFTKITGKSITQLTQAGTDSDKQAIIVVKASELSAGMRYIQGSLRVTTAAADAGVVALAGHTRWADAVKTTAYGDLASVDEIVA